uniref:Uncharacterized protein n=1 Tax=Arundo donax TaxID=35708 RepID=A0A0A9HBG1_ARUDO
MDLSWGSIIFFYTPYCTSTSSSRRHCRGSDEIPEMLRDMAFGFNQTGVGGSDDGCFVNGSEDVEDFYRLIDDASQELYPGCSSFSKLNFLVRLLHTKSLGEWSDKSFDVLLNLLHEAFPEGSALPKKFMKQINWLNVLVLGI